MKSSITLSAFLLIACFPGEQSPKQEADIESYVLPAFLNEVSALAFSNNKLYTLQDEDGIIYVSDSKSIDFKPYLNLQKSGDFEGLTIVDQTFYAIKSNGTIYQIGPNKEIIKHKFYSKSKEYEFEGLAFDSKSNNLLIACKKHAKKSQKEVVWIYSFDLSKKSYKQEPFLKINKSDLSQPFAASGIAIDEEGFIYLISAKKSQLAKLSREGEVLKLNHLNKQLYPQIEGIVIDDMDRVWLASEKNEAEHATLFTFAKR